MNPRRLRSPLRWGTYIAAAACIAYLIARFDSFQLPEAGCSPLLRFAPGESLLLDRWATDYQPGDALLFRGPDERIYLGLVEQLKTFGDGPLWVVADNPECEGRGSDTFGWIAPADRVARVVLKWPW